MLCSYFMSKLYLKLTCFCSFVFCFYIETDLFCFVLFFYFKNEFGLFFCLLCDPWQPLTCSLPCCKEFLIGQFLCHPVSVWATRKYEKKKKKKKIDNKKAISAPTLVCQFNELRVR